jgi:hypothetical protein
VSGLFSFLARIPSPVIHPESKNASLGQAPARWLNQLPERELEAACSFQADHRLLKVMLQLACQIAVTRIAWKSRPFNVRAGQCLVTFFPHGQKYPATTAD